MAELSELEKQIKEAIDELRKSDGGLHELLTKANKRRALFSDANEYALRLGDLLADVLERYAPSSVNAIGYLSPEFVDAFCNELYRSMGYSLDYAVRVQKDLNRSAGIGLNVATPEISGGRVTDLRSKLESLPFEECKEFLDKKILQSATSSEVVDVIEENCKLQSKAGMDPTIERKPDADPCPWCARLVGKYKYSRKPDDIFRRHSGCCCTVEYYPGTGRKVQDVWSKNWLR